MNPSLIDYYARRADEYERVYRKPERQGDLGTLALLVRKLLAGHDVLEIACGTGYWTEALASVARSVLATDASPDVLELAGRKVYPADRVRFAVADAYAPDQIPGRFTAIFAGFWWSHVPRQGLAGFLHALHRRLGAGARVVFCDNRYARGSSTPLTRIDEAGNTYQYRRLENGEAYEVLKNFPTAEEVGRVLRAQGAVDITLTELTYYWHVTYLIGAAIP